MDVARNKSEFPDFFSLSSYIMKSMFLISGFDF
jgi:hypothetical protein